MPDPNTLAQQALEYQTILDHAGIALVFTRERRVYRCNRRAEELFDWPQGTLVGQPGTVFYPSAEAYAAIGALAGPLLGAGQTVETDCVLARRDGSTFFAHLIARAVDPGNTDSGTVWIATDTTSARLESEAGQRLLREQQLIFERARIGIMFSRDRRILRCNPRFEEILGYPKGALVGQLTRVFAPSEEAWLDIGRRVYPAIAASGVFLGEERFIRRDGQPIWCHVTGSMLNPENADDGYVWLYEDISARRQANEALQRSNREYALIFENAMIGISYMRDRKFLRCNHRLEEIFGFPPGGLVGQSSRVLFASDADWEEAGRRVYAETLPGAGFSGEIRYQRRDGTPIWVRAAGQPIREGDDEIWIWTHQDVTRRHLAEQALLDSHRELEAKVAERTAELSQQLHFMHQLIEAIPGPVFYKDAESRYLGANSAFEAFIGIGREEIIGKKPHDIAPAELADKYMASDRALFANPGKQIYEAPTRFADGSLHDVMFHKATFTNPDGSVGGIVGVMLDISERKQLEVRMQQAATVFDSTADGVTITAADGTIIAINRAFTEITGYGEDEVIGRNPRMLQSGRQSAEFYQELWQTILRSGRWQGEIWNKHKDGHLYPEWLTISAVTDGSGKVTHYVGVFSDITVIKQAQEQLDYQAHHDPLTGLPNRLLLEDRLSGALQRARREDASIALLFVDLDRFKNINDTLGHHVGDRVLCEIAQRLSALTRESDTIARLGGDEFLIVVEGVGEPGAASRIADKILDDLSGRPVRLEQEFFIGASIGISLFPQDGDDAPTLMKHADVAMYRAKERGRNTYEFYTNDLTRFSLERFRMETGLRHAIDRAELRVFLQPQFALADGRLIGAEALVRWQHPEHGLVLPGKFIPLAEESGLIVPMGEWVQADACRRWAEWTKAGLAPGVLSLNVSGIEFSRGSIEESLRRTLEISQLPPALLELEITESAIMSQAESSIRLLHGLRAMGLSLAIDDFGTGYSSLAYLKRLPLNRLKIDQGFIRGLPGSAEDAAITRAVIALGHSLQLKVIAEGVETESQRYFLAAEGCDEMQGFLRGRPVTPDEFARLYLKLPPLLDQPQ